MSRFIDLTGQTFDRLFVVKRIQNTKSGKPRWECKCTCGKIVPVSSTNLKSGTSKSCGCLRDELAGNRFRTHGMRKTPEYEVWHSIKQRCNNPKDKGYKNYGGRGIKICKKWEKSFVAFLEHIGHRPSPAHSIDRKNNNGNYKPGNVRWATIQQQHNNYRQNHNITLYGWTMTLTQWAHFVGMNPLTLSGRIKWKWPPAKAIFQPIAIKHRHKNL